MTERHPARQGLHGVSHDNDRLILLHTPDGVRAITEYNDELTGYDPALGALEPEVFCYGGNAYYIRNTYAPAHGWRVEPVEDRR